MVSPQVKCFEFKLYFNAAQRRKVGHWLSLQNWVWNRGLALIEWREWLERWDRVLECGQDLEGVEPTPLRWMLNPDPKAKKEDKWVLACDRVKFRRYNPQTDIDGWQGDDDHWWNPATGEWRERTKDGKGFIVAMPGHEQVKDHWQTDCPLQQVRSNPYFDLVSLFSVGDWKHKLGDCPSKFVAGTCKSLADSWKAYRGGLRDRPRYKGKQRKVETLIHPNSKDIKIKDGCINIPKLGYVKARGLTGRWDGQAFCPMKVCRKGGDYYLQLTYEVEGKVVPHRDARVVGIDPGGKVLAADDMGHQFLPCDVSRLKQRIADLQQKASRQYRANRAEVKDGSAIVAHVDKDAKWRRKNLTKTYQAISRLHERIRRKRLANAHFIADRIISMGDVIVFESVQWTNLSKQNADQLDDKGHFKQNKAKSKSGLNKVMADASPGLLRRLIEEKAKERDRIILLCPSINGFSGICSECGHDHHKAKIDKAVWRPTRGLFHCQNCDRLAHADVNAAQNLKQWGEALVRDGVDVSPYLPGAKPKRSTRKGANKKAA